MSRVVNTCKLQYVENGNPYLDKQNNWFISISESTYLFLYGKDHMNENIETWDVSIQLFWPWWYSTRMHTTLLIYLNIAIDHKNILNGYIKQELNAEY